MRAAFEGRDWALLRSQYHPDASVVSLISPSDAPLSRDQLVGLVEEAVSRGSYDSALWPVLDLDEHAATAMASVRQPSPMGGSTHTEVCWVSTFVDNLLYRSRPFGSEAEAYHAYGELGIELGMPRLRDD